MSGGICVGREDLVQDVRGRCHISGGNVKNLQRVRNDLHTGPPMAPRRTASAFLAALRASSVSGEPVASIEA